MSTDDVPGAHTARHDVLCMGCWAEAADGSLIYVYSVEGGNVIYSVFDVSRAKPVEYRTAEPEKAFKDNFSWTNRDKTGNKDKWTWHDKTPFPWDRVMKAGFEEGERDISADHTLTAAERVAESLRRMGRSVHRTEGADYSDRTDRELSGTDVSKAIFRKLGKAFDAFLRG